MEFRDQRSQKSMIGVDDSELSVIVEAFESLYYEKQNQKPNRRRSAGGGRKGALPTSRDKVVFCLYYLKRYPTFDELGNRFGLARSSAFESLQNHLPLLKAALDKLGVLPPDSFQKPSDLADHLEKKDN
ncbi:MAG: transposase family protein [Saprospiraceae bacterium]|nr:transposase family protein [Saprospiraceae bacterium]